MTTNSNRKDSPINRIQNALIERYIEETNQALEKVKELITEDIETYVLTKNREKRRKNKKVSQEN